MSILIPIGICFRGYLRQGYLSKFYLSEVGSMIWIIFGLLFGFGIFLTWMRSKSPRNPIETIIPSLNSNFKYYCVYFIALIVSTFAMGFQPVSFGSYVIGQVLFGLSLSFAVILILHENFITLGILNLKKSLKRVISIFIYLCICSIIILPSILAGEFIQTQFFSWLFVLMGLPLVWNFITITLLCLFCIFILGYIFVRVSETKPIFGQIISQKRQKKLQFISLSLIGIFLGSIYFFNSSQTYNFQNPTKPAIPQYIPSLVSNFSISLPSEVQDWEDLFTNVHEVLESNLYLDRATRTQLFAHPSEHFQKGWYWDTAFIVLIWKYYNPIIAEQLLIDYIKGALNPNGLVSHMYYPNCKSGISQPPLFAWASLEVFNRTENSNFLQEIFPLLERAYLYWEQFRDPESNFLYSWQTLDETGQDNTLALGSNPQQSEALDLSCYIAFEAEKMAEIANLLGNKEKSDKYFLKSAQIKNAVRSLCWDNETQFFYSLSKDQQKPIYVKAASAFLTLISGIASESQADFLINRYLLNSSEFGTYFPVPTTSLSDPTFEPYYWRGPVWVCMNYLIAKGLERYNRTDVAQSIYLKTIEMVSQVFQERGKVYELYHPITGNVTDVFNPSGGLPSSNMVGWSGLVNNIMIEEILGIKEHKNRLTIVPNFPNNWTATEITYNSPRFKVDYSINSSSEFKIDVVLKDNSLQYFPS